MESFSTEGGGCVVSDAVGEFVKFQLKFGKKTFDVELERNKTVFDFKQVVSELTGIQIPLQTLMFRSKLKDDSKTLSEIGLKNGSKVMLVGSSLESVMEIQKKPVSNENQPAAQSISSSAREKMCDKTQVKKVISKGPPDGALKPRKGIDEALPPNGLTNLFNNNGTKVRLTFKTFTRELWIQSAANTQKLPFSSIRNVLIEDIPDHSGYQLVSLQLGSGTESYYNLFFVPCQYSRALKSLLLSGD